MNAETNLLFSNAELSLAANKDVILTKRVIISKVSAIFSNLVPVLNDAFKGIITTGQIPVGAPKISKGENYDGYPYVILDYPAVFNKEDRFAVRTMFWWGNFISITLHLAGKYKAFFEPTIFLKMKTGNDLFICVNEEEWSHDFTSNNYLRASEIEDTSLKEISSRNFMKLALQYPVSEINNSKEFLSRGFKKAANLLQ